MEQAREAKDVATFGDSWTDEFTQTDRTRRWLDDKTWPSWPYDEPMFYLVAPFELVYVFDDSHCAVAAVESVTEPASKSEILTDP
eukprot:scaffold3084_cov144-Cylindrotheca_fusiformis.AAC.24